MISDDTKSKDFIQRTKIISSTYNNVLESTCILAVLFARVATAINIELLKGCRLEVCE